MAGLLSKLKTSNVRPITSGGSDPVLRARAKLVGAIDEQRVSVEDALQGKSYKTIRKKVGKKEVERTFRPWHFKVGNVYFTLVRYATSPILINGHTAIEAGEDQKNLLEIYDLLKRAINAGELDEQLAQLSKVRGRKQKSEDQTQTRGGGRRRAEAR